MLNYMVPDLEMMNNFEEAVYKKHEEINDGMAEMMSLLHEYTKGEAPEKVLVREDGRWVKEINIDDVKLESLKHYV
nr:hypothetical protein [Tanacetum cinerariifolium]